MNRCFARAPIVFVAAGLAFAALAPAASVAQSTADAVAGGAAVAGSAAAMLRGEMLSRRAERDAANARARRQASEQPAPATAASATPVPFSNSLETPKPGFAHPNAPGISYTLDVSSAFAAGSTGFKPNSLPGGFDAAVYLAPDKYARVYAGYYQLSEYPIGFDTGVVPTYVANTAGDGLAGLPGFPPNGRSNCQAFGPNHINLTNLVPNCPANLQALQNDATLKNRLFVLSLQKIAYVGGVLPIVISPTYVSRKGTVGGSDDRLYAYNPSTFTYQQVHVRQQEIKQIFVSVPLANSPTLFAVVTAGPQWNVHQDGLNATNHPQLFTELDLRYFATPTTTFFFQPSRLNDYLPNDVYPQHIPTLITGVNKRLGGPKSPLFVQAYLAEGTSQNPNYGHTGRIGVIDVTCISGYPNCSASPNPRTNTAITFGGFKASQFVLQIGIGDPSVIPL